MSHATSLDTRYIIFISNTALSTSEYSSVSPISASPFSDAKSLAARRTRFATSGLSFTNTFSA